MLNSSISAITGEISGSGCGDWHELHKFQQ